MKILFCASSFSWGTSDQKETRISLVIELQFVNILLTACWLRIWWFAAGRRFHMVPLKNILITNVNQLYHRWYTWHSTVVLPWSPVIHKALKWLKLKRNNWEKVQNFIYISIDIMFPQIKKRKKKLLWYISARFNQHIKLSQLVLAESSYKCCIA